MKLNQEKMLCFMLICIIKQNRFSVCRKLSAYDFVYAYVCAVRKWLTCTLAVPIIDSSSNFFFFHRILCDFFLLSVCVRLRVYQNIHASARRHNVSKFEIKHWYNIFPFHTIGTSPYPGLSNAITKLETRKKNS